MAFQYNQSLNGLVGREVRVNRGGPDSEAGRLLYVSNDVLALHSANGVVYFHTQHIKSISETGGAGSAGSRSGMRAIPAVNFASLLHRLKYVNVRINRGGPEKLEGLLVDVTNDFIVIVVKGELVRLPIFHIKSITVLGSSENRSNNQNQNKNKDGNKTNGNRTGGSGSGGSKTGGNKTGGNRTGGNRTGGNKTCGSKTGNSGRRR